MRLKLNEHQDHYGYFYGQATDGDHFFRINLLPPGELGAAKEGTPDRWDAIVDGEVIGSFVDRPEAEDLIKSHCSEKAAN